MMDSSMLKVGGQYFRCVCGANVFHKGVKPGLWIFNGCGTEYTDENYDHRKSNADRIRAMNDEEMADAMCRNPIFTVCDAVCKGDCKAVDTLNDTKEAVCKRTILDWLHQPAEED